jgi:hypothetical protein
MRSAASSTDSPLDRKVTLIPICSGEISSEKWILSPEIPVPLKSLFPAVAFNLL